MLRRKNEFKNLCIMKVFGIIKSNYIILFVLLIISSVLNAQDSLNKRPFWLNLSAGGSPDYLNISLSYNKSLEKLSYQIAVNGSTDGILGRNNMTTGNIGFGFSDRKNWMISSVFCGPSLSYGDGHTNSNDYVYFWGAGLTANAQAYFMPLYKIFPDLAIGFELFYNFNVIQTKDISIRHVYSIRIGGCVTNLHMH
jgi:hypothetical protein